MPEIANLRTPLMQNLEPVPVGPCRQKKNRERCACESFLNPRLDVAVRRIAKHPLAVPIKFQSILVGARCPVGLIRAWVQIEAKFSVESFVQPRRRAPTIAS